MKESNWVSSLIFAASLLLQLGTFPFHSHAAPGDVDLSFDSGSGLNGPVHEVALQSDGKVLVGGDTLLPVSCGRHALLVLEMQSSSIANQPCRQQADLPMPDGSPLFWASDAGKSWLIPSNPERGSP